MFSGKILKIHNLKIPDLLTHLIFLCDEDFNIKVLDMSRKTLAYGNPNLDSNICIWVLKHKKVNCSKNTYHKTSI